MQHIPDHNQSSIPKSRRDYQINNVVPSDVFTFDVSLTQLNSLVEVKKAKGGKGGKRPVWY